MEPIFTFIGILLGGGILTFIQFLISRSDSKDEKDNEVLKEIRDLRSDVSQLRDDVERHNIERKRASILQFNDELANDVNHEHESFLEVLDLIKDYQKYCNEHPNFLNGRTEQSCDNIHRTYERLFDKGKFKE